MKQRLKGEKLRMDAEERGERKAEHSLRTVSLKSQEATFFFFFVFFFLNGQGPAQRAEVKARGHKEN